MKLRLTPLSRIAAATRYARSFGAVFFFAFPFFAPDFFAAAPLPAPALPGCVGIC